MHLVFHRRQCLHYHLLPDKCQYSHRLRRHQYHQDDGVGGEPSTLLAQTNAIPAELGTIYNPLNSPAIVPSSGTVWVGFETDSSAMQAYYGIGTRKQIQHTFGDGPDPAGTVGTNISPFWAGIEIVGSTSSGMLDNGQDIFLTGGWDDKLR